MAWVWVVVAAGVAGLLMLAFFAWWLWRKLAVLFSELGRLADQAGSAADLLAHIGEPPTPPTATRSAPPTPPTDAVRGEAGGVA